MSNIPTFNTLEKLEILEVQDLSNLSGILLNVSSESSPAGQYSHLKVVRIYRCHKVMKLISSKLMSKLKNLEQIDVYRCTEMEELIAVDDDDDNEERSPTEFLLPKLKRLSLSSMTELKSICSCNGLVMVCDSLQVINVLDCPKLKKILSSSSKLQLGVLKNLEEIDVQNCGEMEEIIAIDDVDCKKEFIISLPKLRKLTLSGIRELKSIINVCGSNGVMVCDSLQVIVIWGCPKLKKIISSSSKLQLGVLKNLEEIDVAGCVEMEEIIAIDDVDCKKELIISLPKLRYLTLFHMRELKSIINVCGSTNGVLMVCDSLQQIDIWGCPQLKRLPIYLPVDEKGEPSPPPALNKIKVTRGWWEALEWDNPNAQTLLLPFCEFRD